MGTGDSSELLPGTLDLLILKALALAPMHGWAIAQRLEQLSRDALRVGQGSLYPALQRLEKTGSITSRWEEVEPGRELKLYRLTAKGRRQLAVEQSKWQELAGAMARMLRPAE